MSGYTHDQLWQVFDKARRIPDFGHEWRWDRFGAVMLWKEYGNRDSKHGWEVDHINPDGPDTASNWEALNWDSNVKKSDKHI